MNNIRIIDYLDILHVRVPANEETQKIYEALREMALKHSALVLKVPRDRDAFSELFLAKNKDSEGIVSMTIAKCRPSGKAFDFGYFDSEIKIS